MALQQKLTKLIIGTGINKRLEIKFICKQKLYKALYTYHGLCRSKSLIHKMQKNYNSKDLKTH
jgi:hypothetical protein